jgi:hypothetical protein
MRRFLLRATRIVLAGDAASNAAAADCTSRARGQDFELGQSTCLATAKGARIAICGMVLNNTSWQFSDTPCMVSDAPARRPASTAKHAQHHLHGG